MSDQDQACGANTGWVKRGRLVSLFFALVLVIVSVVEIEWAVISDGDYTYDVTLYTYQNDEMGNLTLVSWNYKYLRSFRLGPLFVRQCDAIVDGSPYSPNISYAGLHTCTSFSFNFMLKHFVDSGNKKFYQSCETSGINAFSIAIVSLAFIFLSIVAMIFTAVSKDHKARWRFIAFIFGCLASLFIIASMWTYLTGCINYDPPRYNGSERKVTAGAGYILGCLGAVFACGYVALQFWFFCCKTCCVRGEKSSKKKSVKMKKKAPKSDDEDDGGFGEKSPSPRKKRATNFDDEENPPTKRYASKELSEESFTSKPVSRERSSGEGEEGSKAAWKETSDAPAPSRSKRNGDWEEIREEDGVYWFNHRTQETSWTKPN